MKTTIIFCLIFWACLCSSINPVSAQNRPTIGFAAYTTEGPGFNDYFLNRLEDGCIRRILNTNFYRIIERTGLPELYSLREEQKNEAYLDNQISLQSLGVRYLFLTHLSSYQNGVTTNEETREQTFYSQLNIRLRILDVQTGEIRGSTSQLITAKKKVQEGQDDYNADMSLIRPELNKSIQDNIVNFATNFFRKTLPRKLQVVEVVKKTKKKVSWVLFVAQAPLTGLNSVKLYVNETVTVDGESLTREVSIGDLAIRSLNGRFGQGKVGSGKKKVLELIEQGQTIYGKPY